MEWMYDKAKENNPEATEDEITEIVDTLLDEENFERNYPEISAKITEVLDRIDNIDSIGDDPHIALRVATAKHLRQRGTSGQRLLSASSGFTSVLGAREKMIKGLAFYK